MRYTIMFWVIAFLLTVASAVYQRLTGPTYALRGSAAIPGGEVSYAFERSFITGEPASVFIRVPDSTAMAVLRWRVAGSGSAWQVEPMTYVAGTRRADLPDQQPLDKLEYQVEVTKDSVVSTLPGSAAVIARFKGPVPLWVIVPHVLLMFFAMMLSTRAGLEVFSREPRLHRYAAITLVSLIGGGFVFGPLMSYYAFGLFWTGWPVGQDITDNKTLIALVGWLVAWGMLRKPKQAKWWVLAASIIMLGIFLVPHSI